MNKYIDVLLVNPPIPSPKEHSFYGRMSAPLGLCYLGTTLMKAGYTVNVIDLGIDKTPLESLMDKLRICKPKIIGITMTTQSYYVVIQLAMLIKKYLKKSNIIIGGSHASYDFGNILKTNSVDVVVRFEAEDTLVELANYFINKKGDLGKIKGIVYQHNSTIIRNKDRPLNTDLDSIPIPDRSLINLEKYPRPGTIMSSRGCVKKCVFCVAGNYEGNYRSRSPEGVIEELSTMYYDFKINDFYFIDNVFSADLLRVDKICSLIHKSKMSLAFYCVVRLDTINRQLMETLNSAGCYRAEIGVESGNQNIIDTLNKGIFVEQVCEAAEISLKCGIQPMFTFQIGHAHDTIESMNDTVNLIRKLRRKGAGAYLSVMTPFIGTPIFNERKKFGIKIDANSWEDFRMTNPISITNNFSLNDIRKILFSEYVAHTTK